MMPEALVTEWERALFGPFMAFHSQSTGSETQLDMFQASSSQHAPSRAEAIRKELLCSSPP